MLEYGLSNQHLCMYTYICRDAYVYIVILSRGYMFVEYESHKAAAMARRRLTQGNHC